MLNQNNTSPLATPQGREVSIEFRNVSFKYHPDGDIILKGISFAIYKREKIGIVGRTVNVKEYLIDFLKYCFRVRDQESRLYLFACLELQS